MATLSCKSVLVPIDFSEQAFEAVELGLELAGEPEKLTVLHVAVPTDSFMVGDPAVVWQQVSSETRTDYFQKEFRDHFPSSEYDAVRFEVVFGNPADEIARCAQDFQTDLIILPSHGRTGLARLMIGSVAEHVVRLAHCPVLVLRS